MDGIRLSCRIAGTALAVAAEAYAVNGIAVSAVWEGNNANLYGGWGKVYRYDIANNQVAGEPVELYGGEARFATLSPNASQVAFIKKSGIVAVVDVGGGAERDLVDAGSGKGYLDWPAGRELYYSRGGYGEQGSRELWKVNVDTKETAQIHTFNTNMWLWGFALDGNRATVRPEDGQDGPSTGHVYRYELNHKVELKKGIPDDLGLGCGNAISPEGEYIMRFDGYGHDNIVFHHWDGSEAKSLHKNVMNGWGRDMGSGWNRNRWSCNSEKWICTMQGWDGRQAKQGSNMVLYNWQDEEQVVVTDHANGGGKQSGAGDFWAGEPNAIRLQPRGESRLPPRTPMRDITGRRIAGDVRGFGPWIAAFTISD